MPDELKATDRDMIASAVGPMMDACGNSYANAWLEKWLRWARDKGAYNGPVIGRIVALKEDWERRRDGGDV